jgi:hypothetical protein
VSGIRVDTFYRQTFRINQMHLSLKHSVTPACRYLATLTSKERGLGDVTLVVWPPPLCYSGGATQGNNQQFRFSTNCQPWQSNRSEVISHPDPF